MADWKAEDLEAIGGTGEIQISSPRADGSMRDPVTIWVVRVGDDLYVRSVRGEHGAWYQGAEDGHHGRVEGGGSAVEVEFEDVGEDRGDEIDAAYGAKYAGSPDSVEAINSAAAKATTIRLTPRAS